MPSVDDGAERPELPDPGVPGPGVPGALEAEYAVQYGDLYARHWWWRAREEAVLREVGRIADEWDGGHRAILDVGCGDGLILPKLARFGDVEGVEPDERLVTGRSDQVIHVVPFEDFSPVRSYSLILMLDVLEHLPDPVAALRRCREILEPGGRILLTVPAFMALWTTHDDLNHHFTRYRTGTLRAVARDAALELLDARYLFHWVSVAKLGVRLKEALRPGPPSPPRVPPASVNRALLGLCRLERRTLAPLRLPFGSSLLGICSVPPAP
jgi:2-polyprenyl-3-methyl-5-hydroxy-6-metoxy-1,4-benzoquinol methylase